MKGQVKKLCDIDSLEIPAELLELHVDEKQVEAQIDGLSMRYAKEETVNVVETGSTVYCTADKESYPDGRTVLLYTGVGMPGAEEAEKAALGKKTGDVFSAALCGKPVTLTVRKITHRTPTEVTDALIASIGIENVRTIADYRRCLYAKALEDEKMEQSKAFSRFYAEKMTELSDYDYDEDEMNAYIESQMQEAKAQSEEEGFPFDETETREAILAQQKQIWMAEAFCKAHDIPLDEAEIEEQADQTAEMMSLMGEPVPSREELLETAREDAAMTGFFTYVDKIAEEKTGGANGNG